MYFSEILPLKDIKTLLVSIESIPCSGKRLPKEIQNVLDYFIFEDIYNRNCMGSGKLPSIIYQVTEENKLIELHRSRELGEAYVSDTNFFTASHLSLKIRCIHWNTRYTRISRDVKSIAIRSG